MLAVHALWDAGDVGELVLWAEDGSPRPRHRPQDRTRVPARRSRSPARPAPHPFAADAETLAAALASYGEPLVTGVAAQGARGTATLRLPGVPGLPDASPWLVRFDAASRSPRAGRAAAGSGRGAWPFDVPVLRWAPGAAMDVLLGLARHDASEVRAGPSVDALARVAELALEVVAGGRVLPSLVVDEEGRSHARWEPLQVGHDTERLVLLARALPQACRSLSGARGPSGTVSHAFGTFVDAVCRQSSVAAAPPWARRRARAGTPSLEAWIAALFAPDGMVRGGRELAGLRQLVDDWRAPLAAPSGSWRLCFRLLEPDDAGGSGSDGGTWRVELLLQPSDDPSLLVTASEVWRSGESLRRAARTVDAPHEVLLTELGRAVLAFPGLAPALARPAPTEVEMDLAAAHLFLSETAPALELAGFGVLLPAWWRRPAMRLGLRLRASSPSSAATSSARRHGRLTLAGIATVDWQAALGDEQIGLAELRRLARLKAPLVRVRGQWMELRPDEVERLVGFLAAGHRREMPVVDVVRAASGVPPDGVGVPVLGVEATGALEALLRGGLADTVTVGGTPAGFCGELRPYQQRGVAWIELLERTGLGACLADDMGLGKTAMVLGVLQAERRADVAEPLGPTLVVCPTSVVGNWQAEVARFTPALSVVVHHGASRARGDAMVRAFEGADVVVTSYPLVERDRTALAAVPWRRVVLDEAQQVKNPGAKQTQAVRALTAPRRVALTGTPVENHLGELWSIMEILNPGLLGSQASFRDRFAVPIERYGDEDAAERLRALTRPFVLRRLKTDTSIISDLPDKLEMKVRCSLTREQATLYQAVVDEMLGEIAGAEGIERRGLVLAAMLRLKQVCNHPAQYLGDGSALPGRSGKLERTVEILEEARDLGEKALVFTQFSEMGAMLQAHLQQRLGCRVGFLYGGVPRARRDEMVAELQAPGDALPVMVLSLKAGGTGLNLTAANHVVHYDRWWNPAVEAQATDRAFRIGQRRDVQVRTLVCAGTVEDRIDEMIESKRALADRIVGTGERWLTELSTDELAEVLRLSAGPVGAA